MSPTTQTLTTEVAGDSDGNDEGGATNEFRVEAAAVLSGDWFASLPRYRAVAGMLSGRRVLEIGCGEGIGTAAVLEAVPESITAVDARPMLVERAQVRLGESATVLCGELSEIGFDDNAFDAVICLSRDVTGDAAILGEIDRVLDDRGLFVAAWSLSGTYGLEHVLPAPTPAAGQTMDFVEACGALSEHFPLIAALNQTAELGFRFSSFDELPVPGMSEAPGDDVHLQGDDGADLRRVVFICARGEDAVDGARIPGRVTLPYHAIAQRLGGVMGQLHRSAELISQQNLVLEGRVEDQVQLTVDLEEEVREQRALAADQAERIARGGGPMDPAAAGGDLAMQYARVQGDLAATQQEMIERTGEFSTRIQDVMWSMQERDRYIDHLVETVRGWEEYANHALGELEARDLALANLGEVYRRTQAELTALCPDYRADPNDPMGGVIMELRRGNDAVAADLAEARRELVDAYLGRAEAERGRTQARTDESEHRHLAAALSTQLAEKAAELTAFSGEVSAVIEERNQLLREREKLLGRLKEVENQAETKHDAHMDVEKEMHLRTLKIAALERERMGKNIEMIGLEKENMALLVLKADGDAIIDGLKAKISALGEAASAAKPKAKAPAKPKAKAPAKAKAKAPAKAKAKAPAKAKAKAPAKAKAKAPAKAPAKPKAPAKAKAKAPAKAKATKAPASVKAKVPGRAKPKAPAQSTARKVAPAGTATRLASRSVKELRERARELGLKGYSNWKKAELIAALQKS
jgi:SAM-dependent methyltransferase/regulator of replication initiation timing